MSDPIDTKAVASRGPLILGVALAMIALLAAIGGIRLVGLLALATDFAFYPCELAALPIGIVALILCRTTSAKTSTRLRRLGTILAVCAIVVSLLIGTLPIWGYALSTGAFP